MAIRCGDCYSLLEDQDHVVLDEFNTLRHTYCGYDLVSELVQDVGTYKNIKEKYQFFSEEVK
ncbi:hypothetical protein [Peribacillus asahii]|uniref:Uncharacterized protein n=1 Tax=Peribacillus asahii TaxID=228899 RepID=A0A3T0KYE7_9BACI|nr:hypothetical protein [Peribacillus asahii]AZV45364.1 hypothetical protein BAOM_4798 [Peribacillus asahii]USK84946.1 hypothetical protein LIT35_21690 [Peribacillus asahii]